MTTFHNYVLKVETGWAARMFKSILETRNVNCVCEYVWLPFLTQIIIWSLRNQWFLNFNCFLLLIKLANGLEILLWWPMGIPLPIQTI